MSDHEEAHGRRSFLKTGSATLGVAALGVAAATKGADAATPAPARRVPGAHIEVRITDAPEHKAKALSAGGAQTARWYIWNMQGLTRCNMNWGAINNDSVVLVTASEYSPDPNDPQHSPRFLGSAEITVENICPHGPPYDPNHGVAFDVNVNWGSPLHVVCDVTVLDNPPVDIEYQGG